MVRKPCIVSSFSADMLGKRNRSKYLITYHLYARDATLQTSLFSQFLAAFSSLLYLYINNFSQLSGYPNYKHPIWHPHPWRSDLCQRGTEKPDFEVTSPPRRQRLHNLPNSPWWDGEGLDFWLKFLFFGLPSMGRLHIYLRICIVDFLW